MKNRHSGYDLLEQLQRWDRDISSSPMLFTKNRFESRTLSGPRGGAQDEFSPCLLNLPPPSPTLCQAVREMGGGRARETQARAEQPQQQWHCSPPAPVFIPAWALDVITAQLSTLTETESSQRQQQWLRGRERPRRKRRAQRFTAASVMQECPLLPLVSESTKHTHAHRQTHTYTHRYRDTCTLWNQPLKEALCVYALYIHQSSLN